jgi:hypothetical protein
VLLVDLDTNQLSMPSDQSVQIPSFPAYETSILRVKYKFYYFYKLVNLI